MIKKQTKEIRRLTKLIEDSSYLSIYKTSNKILYKMFRDYPENKAAEHIVAKVLILGRTYAAAIERRKTGDKLSNDAFYLKKVPKAFKSVGIDEGISKIRKTNDELKRASQCLKLHSKLQASIKSITKQNKRSLCSKYLHFQLPEEFFIYDTRAIKGLRKLKKLLPQMKEYREQFHNFNEGWDKEYYSFFRDCYCLNKLISDSLGNNLTKRELDSLLITSQLGKYKRIFA